MLSAELTGTSSLTTEWFQTRKHELTIASLPQERFGTGLVLGGGLELGPDLVGRCDRLTITGCHESFIPTLRALEGGTRLDLRPARATDAWPEGSFDLVVIVDTASFFTPLELDEVIGNIRSSLAPGGCVLLCHWREAVAGLRLDGDAVHSRFLATSGLESMVTYREPHFAIDILRRPQLLA